MKTKFLARITAYVNSPFGDYFEDCAALRFVPQADLDRFMSDAKAEACGDMAQVTGAFTVYRDIPVFEKIAGMLAHFADMDKPENAGRDQMDVHREQVAQEKKSRDLGIPDYFKVPEGSEVRVSDLGGGITKTEVFDPVAGYAKTVFLTGDHTGTTQLDCDAQGPVGWSCD